MSRVDSAVSSRSTRSGRRVGDVSPPAARTLRPTAARLKRHSKWDTLNLAAYRATALLNCHASLAVALSLNAEVARLADAPFPWDSRDDETPTVSMATANLTLPCTPAKPVASASQPVASTVRARRSKRPLLEALDSHDCSTPAHRARNSAPQAKRSPVPVRRRMRMTPVDQQTMTEGELDV